LYKKSAEQGYKEAFNGLAWTYHLLGKYEEALPWAEKAIAAFPNTPYIIDTLASVYQDLGRYDDALEQFELCLKLYKEQENSEGINKTDTKIAELKELMKNGGVPEQ
jgi:tetratricopeptide (TPR) repeat protein